MNTIIITETAKVHLRDIAVYIAEQSKDGEIAKKFVKELETVCNTLGEFTDIGANPDDRLLLNMGYKYLIHKDYLIFYTVEQAEKTVYIQAVFNAKRDYTRFLRQFVK